MEGDSALRLAQSCLDRLDRLESSQAPFHSRILAGEIDSGDTTWVMVSTFLVIFMTIPGQAIFYAGMVRTENVLATSMQVISITAMISVCWMIFGYSLAFGPANADRDSSKIFGDGSRIFLTGMSEDSIHQLAPTIPETAFCTFQLTFAIASPVLMCGSFAERMAFTPMLIFMFFWHFLVYCPMAHTFWHPDGWLYNEGVLDFAGGCVIHLSAGIASLICVKIIGARHLRNDNFEANSEPHNVLFTVIGACMMWGTWYGFNAGSAVAANTNAAMVLLNTHIAASVAACTWELVEWFHRGAPSVVGMVNGACCGLVCVTPACGYISPQAAFIIGLFGGPFCFYGLRVKNYFGIDDALDAFGVNTFGGLFGTIMTGFLASRNTAGYAGLFYADNAHDGWHRLGLQVLGVVFVSFWSGVISFVLLVVINETIGLRVSAEVERKGLDVALQGETIVHHDHIQKHTSMHDLYIDGIHIPMDPTQHNSQSNPLHDPLLTDPPEPPMEHEHETAHAPAHTITPALVPLYSSEADEVPVGEGDITLQPGEYIYREDDD
jgi:Amt family ammonium transporter